MSLHNILWPDQVKRSKAAYIIKLLTYYFPRGIIGESKIFKFSLWNNNNKNKWNYLLHSIKIWVILWEIHVGPFHLVIHVQNYPPCAQSLFLSSSWLRRRKAGSGWSRFEVVADWTSGLVNIVFSVEVEVELVWRSTCHPLHALTMHLNVVLTTTKMNMGQKHPTPFKLVFRVCASSDKPKFITDPAVPSTRLWGRGLKLYPSDMQCIAQQRSYLFCMESQVCQ